MHVLEPGEDARLAAIAAAEGGSEVLGVAGGDGSVSAVATVAAEREVALVIVPMGTLNHFARDLGLDLARPLSALDELRRALRITPPEGAPLEGVLAVVVSNNPYEFARLDRLGRRHRLDTGMLQISVLDASTLDELVERLLAGTLSGAIEIRPALRHWMSEHLEMGVLGERVRVGVDGEPIILEAPLRFSVEPGALRVLVPEGVPEDRQVPPLEAGVHAARTLRQWLRPTLAE